MASFVPTDLPVTRRRRRPSSTARTPIDAWDEIHPTLDLHGSTADVAARRVDRWLREMQSNGVSTVRVITGRGLHSPGRPVLRDRIEEVLKTLRGSVVARFSAEPGGAVLRIELHAARASTAGGAPRSDAATLRNVDPDLRRRAEGALRELGVEPTPVLLRAEVERIRRERETP